MHHLGCVWSCKHRPLDDGEVNREEKAAAAIKLVSIREILESLRGAFDDIIEVAQHEDEPRLAFSAMMLQESIESFSTELSSFVVKKIAEE